MVKSKTTAKTGTRKAAGTTAAKKTKAKKTVARKPAKKAAGMKEGSSYVCGVCGLAVTVDTACGCAETAHLICCGKPMTTKR
ncbi:MAG: hypothetical protein M0Z67_12890 [Nitrospiraceae bacterium]|nr:hypothetical protein [Nitrospiraceae bacterium]